MDPNSLEYFSALKQSESERNSILKCEEEMWRLRSRALWLSSGDRNTRYFHKVVAHNRTKKHLWEIDTGDGELITDQDSLKSEAVNYYKTLYKAPSTLNILDQCKITDLFSQWVNEEEANELVSLVTLEELQGVLG
jgi:hypothetical protein